MTRSDLVRPRPHLVPDEVADVSDFVPQQPPLTGGFWDEVTSEDHRTTHVVHETGRGQRTPHPAEHLAGTNLRASTCRTCGQPVLLGLDADEMAVDVTVDPAPLDAHTEALARLAGRRTYRLHYPAFGRNAKLTRRNANDIRRYPAGAPIGAWHAYDIVPAHACYSPLPAIGSMLTPINPTTEADDEPCPF